MKHSLPYLFLLMIAVAACKPTVPSKYIQPDEMEDILYDYHVAQAMAKNGQNTGYNSHLYYLAVLKKHGVTEAEFDSSLVYYYSRIDRFKEMYAHVSERLNGEAKSLGAVVGDINRYSQYSATGDTANIWNLQPEVLLIPRPTMNRFDFTIKADTSFYLGDSFMFQFMSEYLWQSGSKDAVVCIVTKYEGDSIVQTTSHISGSGSAQVRVPANNEQKVKEIRGFIYLNDGNDDSDTRKMLFASQLQLIRFHNKQLKHDTNKTDTLAKDSVQRGGDYRR